MSPSPISSEPVQNSSPDIVRRDRQFGVIMGSIGITMLYASCVSDILGARIVAGLTGTGFILAGGCSFFLHKKKKSN